ncbi:conjugal transfer protein TraF [Escherichia coli]|nr:conjugal transfer protein TraF [Edwardsiella anguillarum]EFP0183602.1 conjugal transfer protein TraF [Escherichia coli]EGA8339541.1 conjugal transfer protein TraF [Salmonella enterica subsp. enterica serovar Saintpaul]KAB0589197.1 conjugal transfer protein TraF [Edwardsiella anguillarum]
MRKPALNLLSFLATLSLSLGGISHTWAQDGSESRFYDRKAEGWFWYKQDPLEPEEKPKEPEPKPIPVEEAKPALPKQEETSPAGPEMFSAKWFRDNLPKYKDLAWDNPTVENVRTFLYLQRFAIDRSEQFSDATELAVVGDPFLDEITRRPAATFASQQVDRDAGNAKNQLLKTVAQRVGIFFFYKSNDEYSDLQAPLIKMLEQSEGFSIVPVSMDGKPLRNGLFPSFKIDNGHAKQLGIVTFPAVYLASPNGEFAPIGQGPMSLPELNHRILVAAKRNAWISDEEFNRTRPVLNLENNIAERLASPDLSKDLHNLSQANSNETNFVPPNQLMQYIREKLQEN